jgi:hypothetical protein
VRELVGSLVLGTCLIVAGGLLFRFRRAIVSQNYDMRRPILGGFLSKAMSGGDRLMFPIIAALFAALGAGLIVLAVYRVLHSQG